MIFQGFTEIQNGRHGSTSIFLWAQKPKKLVWSFFWHFNITFLATWGCASDFLKMLPKSKMAARGQHNFFCGFCWNSKLPPRITFNFSVGAKTQKLKVINYSNFAITFPTIWRCAGDCLEVLLKFKMAAMDELYIFLWAQKFKNWNQKKITFYNHITLHLEICRWFYWNLKWPPQVDFLNICDRKNSNLIYGGEWYRTSCRPLVLYRPT